MEGEFKSMSSFSWNNYSNCQYSLNGKGHLKNRFSKDLGHESLILEF